MGNRNDRRSRQVRFCKIHFLLYLNHYYLKEKTILSKEELLFEKIMMGLRLNEGIDYLSLNESFDIDFVNKYQNVINKYKNLQMIELDKQYIKKAVIFSSTWISKHSIELIRKNLQEKGIEVVEDAFYVRGKPSSEKLNEAKAFAKKYIEG